jgi:O-antigen biosynthesis alpha-1,3-rhamnosyltransferase
MSTDRQGGVPLGVIVPTFRARWQLSDCLEPVLASVLKPRVLVIDSSSDDGTMELAREMGVEVISIPQREFDHGATREMARKRVGSEVVVMLTQDAILTSPESLDRIVEVFADPEVVAAYGRQLPHRNAGPIGAHARLFNYPPKSRVKSKSDADELGIKTAFISNSFAAYRQRALDAAGGFPAKVILGEDTCVAARLLLAGGKIAYVAEATAFHSHDYGMIQEFQRYFDTGVFHRQEAWIKEAFGHAESEAARFLLSEMRYLLRRAPYLLPYAIIRSATKYLGYRLGAIGVSLPRQLKRRLSMNKQYWDALREYR